MNKMILSLLIVFIIGISISSVSAVDENNTMISSTDDSITTVESNDASIASDINNENTISNTDQPITYDIDNITTNNIIQSNNNNDVVISDDQPKTHNISENITAEELNTYINEKVNAGDTLNFTKNGVYNFNLIDGIIIDKQLIIQGNNATINALQGLQISSVFSTISGTQIYNLNFNMTNSTAKWNGRGIEIRNGADIVVENCTFLNGNSGIYLSQMQGNITIRNCKFNGTTDTSSIGKNKETGTKAINIMGGTTILVENNFFGSECLDGVSIASGGGNVIVRNNVFEKCWYGVFYGGGVSNVNITNNTSIDIIKIAVDFKKAAGNSIVKNNTFKLVNNGIGVYIEQGNTAHGSPSSIENITITDNTIEALDKTNASAPYTIEAVKIGSQNGGLIPKGTITITNNTIQQGIVPLSFIDLHWIVNETTGDYVIAPITLESKIITGSEGTINAGDSYKMQLATEKGSPLTNQDIQILVKYDESVIDTINAKTDSFGMVEIPLDYKSGEYVLNVLYNGTTETENGYLYDKLDTELYVTIVNDKKTTLTLENDSIYYGSQLKYLLKDETNNPIANTNITINVNGKNYTRTTDKNGNAYMTLNLQPKDYTISATYNNDPSVNTTNIVSVNPIIIANNIVKYYKNGTQFQAKLVDSNGNILVNKSVTFNINGVFYTRNTTTDGIATLSINLNPGDYIITSEYNGCYVSNNVSVKSTLISSDLTKKYLGPEKFTTTVLDGQGKPVAGKTVTFNINGVFYNRTSDDNGVASLSINLLAGEYIITSQYDGYATSNKVTVNA